MVNLGTQYSPDKIRLIGDPFISFLVKTIMFRRLAMAPKIIMTKHIYPCSFLYSRLKSCKSVHIFEGGVDGSISEVGLSDEIVDTIGDSDEIVGT